MRICVLGIHASGKSTIAKLLSRKLNIEYVSTDPVDLLKDHWIFDPYLRGIFFMTISYMLTMRVFRQLNSFVTDFDPILQLVYSKGLGFYDLYKKAFKISIDLPKYDLVIILDIKDPMTIIERALERLRWGYEMYHPKWLNMYFHFTIDILRAFREELNNLCLRGNYCLKIDGEKEVNEVIQDIVHYLNSIS